MPSNIQQAEQMLDLLTSVGARSFVVTKTDIEQKLIWGKSYSSSELREKLPAMVRTAAERKPQHLPDGKTIMAGENLIIRPTGDVIFIQLDDLTTEQLDRLRPASFLIISTSPGNHQAWIAVSHVDKSTSKDVIRRVRQAVGDVDKSASGATRLAGTFNFKQKYEPDFPSVEIIHGIPGRVMTLEQLRGMGLLAEPEPFKPFIAPGRVPRQTDRTWPDYERCVANAQLNHSKTGPDTSRADFFFALLCAQRNWGTEEIAGRLMELSPKARENGEAYARLTAENATVASERRRMSTKRT